MNTKAFTAAAEDFGGVWRAFRAPSYLARVLAA